MNITLEQAIKIMADLFAAQDYNQLKNIAKQITTSNPDIKEAWRYLGMASILQKESGESYLKRAALMNDIEAQQWLNVISEFGFHPKNSIIPYDIVTQVALQKLRRSAYIEYPLEIQIETLTICNAKCTFCPYPTMERQGDKMSEQLIEKIINDLKIIPSNLPFTISPFKVNDPLLDKRIFAVCQSINTELPNAKIRLFTNGSPLNEKNIEKIANIKNMVHLWVSLNEYEEEPYRKLMDLPFTKTIEKLDMLHNLVQAGFPHPVFVSRIADGSERDKGFMTYLAQRYPLFERFLIGRSNWTGQVDIGMQKRILPYSCARWYEVSIMASGKVALCCMDGEGKHVIGDVNNQSVLEIYNSPEYRKMRQYTFSRLAAAAPCNTCIF